MHIGNECELWDIPLTAEPRIGDKTLAIKIDNEIFPCWSVDRVLEMQCSHLVAQGDSE